MEHLAPEDRSLEELFEYHRELAGSHDLLDRSRWFGLRRNIGSVGGVSGQQLNRLLKFQLGKPKESKQ